jgi:hypothetical protein
MVKPSYFGQAPMYHSGNGHRIILLSNRFMGSDGAIFGEHSCYTVSACISVSSDATLSPRDLGFPNRTRVLTLCIVCIKLCIMFCMFLSVPNASVPVANISSALPNSG